MSLYEDVKETKRREKNVLKGWFTEFHTPHVGISLRIKEHLYDGKTQYQKIDVIDTPEYGKVLLLDDLIMITDRDEHVYHEMMVHVPMLTHKKPRKVLVIGGGDGGAVREVCKHPYIEQIDQAEIDGEVIEISKRFFPAVASEYDNPKVHLHITDGFKFVKHHPDEYDIIIVDSTDPFGPGKILFSKEFYTRIFNALRSDGIMTAQVGTPFYNPKHIKGTFKKLREVFPIARPYMAHIPTYTDAYYGLAFCSKKYDHKKDFDRKRYEDLKLGCKYFNPDIQVGAFLLPTYVAILL